LTTQLDTSNNSVTELNIELENEKKKVSNMELKIRAIENGIYETYLSLKFPFDGNTYITNNGFENIFQSYDENLNELFILLENISKYAENDGDKVKDNGAVSLK